jgi:aspartate kinase
LNIQTQNPEQVRIFKFGGASVKNAAGLQNVAEIAKQQLASGGRIVLVVSAMGKTTNALETIVQAAGQGVDFLDQIDALLQTHIAEASAAVKEPEHVLARLHDLGQVLRKQAQRAKDLPFDEAYDQIVSLGEVMSSLCGLVRCSSTY